jgi:hypothetical protein
MYFFRLEEKIEKNYFSSHKLPKQQSTSFWSQGILGVNVILATNFLTQFLLHRSYFINFQIALSSKEISPFS